VQVDKVVDILKMFIYISIVLKLNIEKSKADEDQNGSIIEYLSKITIQTNDYSAIDDSIVA
jgi:hypothetical protein